MSYSTSCYLFPVGRADNWGMMTWTDADAKCRSILAGTAADGMNSHLLFLETKDEQVKNKINSVPIRKNKSL